MTKYNREMPRKKAATGGGLGALITVLMAATAFRKKDLPKLKPANGNEPPTKTQIRDRQRLTRQIWAPGRKRRAYCST